ncbi:SDR family NAD(P)-dependent oxidoreductase [Streptomyces sp. NPDC021020]|uniref:SDR family NAD(P)-dependent oxidoreductase n=1 Tax=Streptomyces sp. NPDC021020 TaxID=3365109 RepID=UPI0037A0B7CF
MSTPATTPSLAPIPIRTPLPSALAGTTAVLVGGTSGIGLAAGVLLRTVGARVVLVGRDPGRLRGAAARVRETAVAARGIPGPGREEGAVLEVAGDGGDERILAEAFDRAGEVDHVLVTAGGIAGAGPLAALTAEGIRTALDSRLQAAFTTARVAADRLPAGGSLTFSSGILVARPAAGMTAPLSAAGAVETLTKALAVELAPTRRRVNAVRFGRIDTPLWRTRPGMSTDEAIAAAGATHPLGRFGTPEEAASAVLFLMANPYMTGQILTLDGGETLA